MSEESALAEALERRKEAWERVHADVAALRKGLAERPIGVRLKDYAADRVVDAVDSAKAVAADNLVVIGGVVAALGGWMFRRPIIRFAERCKARWFGK